MKKFLCTALFLFGFSSVTAAEQANAIEFPTTTKILPLLRELAEFRKPFTMKEWGVLGCSTLGGFASGFAIGAIIGNYANTKFAIPLAVGMAVLAESLVESQIRKQKYTPDIKRMHRLSNVLLRFEAALPLICLDKAKTLNECLVALLYRNDERATLNTIVNPALREIEQILRETVSPQKAVVVKKALKLTTIFATIEPTQEQQIAIDQAKEYLRINETDAPRMSWQAVRFII